MKSKSFHQYSWNSEVETMWISLIGWHHKTSNKYGHATPPDFPAPKSLVSELPSEVSFVSVLEIVLSKFWKIRVGFAPSACKIQQNMIFTASERGAPMIIEHAIEGAEY